MQLKCSYGDLNDTYSKTLCQFVALERWCAYPKELPLNELADRWADEGRQSENIRWSLPTNRPIFYWTDNGTTHRSPMNPTVKKRIDLQVSQQQLKIHTGSTANFLTKEDSSRDLLGKFHKDRSFMDTGKTKGATMPLLSIPLCTTTQTMGHIKRCQMPSL